MTRERVFSVLGIEVFVKMDIFGIQTAEIFLNSAHIPTDMHAVTLIQFLIHVEFL